VGTISSASDVTDHRIQTASLKVAEADTDRPARAIWRRADRSVAFADPFLTDRWYYRVASSAS
jgi:hypothetical protein